MSNLGYYRGPFRTEIIQLQQVVEVGGDRQILHFERLVYWVKDSESTLQYCHGGKVLKEGSCYSDYYGPMTSQRSAVNDAKNIMEAYAITADSSLVLQVNTVVRDIPLQRTKRCEQTDLNDAERKHEMESIPDSWFLQGGDERLEPVVLSEEISWTSKDGKK